MSIKVAVRVRPFNQKELDLGTELCVQMDNNCTKIFKEKQEPREFFFDHSFWSHDGFENDEQGVCKPTDSKYADQDKVYDQIGKDILENAWEGYHCCLFAYGQTGSGKSYSMVGYDNNIGIVPMICNDLFQRIQKQDQETSYEVFISMMEIYNEKMHDLLQNTSQRTLSGLKIREHKRLGVYVEGLTKYAVDSYQDIQHKIDIGNTNRTIASTQMNACSSRAHTIVQIEFKQNHNNTTKFSTINLVDLAGSEKLSKTQASGDRLKEGCNINKSLHVLGLVISNLAEKSFKKNNTVTPYRESILTRILQNALGGNSKTAMICAISPSSFNYEETLSTLRYADQAKKIKCNAVVNETEQDRMIRELREENQLLKQQMSKIQTFDKANLQSDYEQLQEELVKNKFLINQYQKTFKQKLSEAKTTSNQVTQIDFEKPFLQNLNEDPLLTGKACQQLSCEITYVGKKQGNNEIKPIIILNSLGIQPLHAKFHNENSTIFLEPYNEHCLNIFVNGQRISEKMQLYHNDRIIFGANTVFLFQQPKGRKFRLSITQTEFDWEFAQKEKHENERVKQTSNEYYSNSIDQLKGLEFYKKNESMIKEISANAQWEQTRLRQEQDYQYKIQKLIPKIQELNLIAQEMSRQVVFGVEIPYIYFEDPEHSQKKIQIKVANKEETALYYWKIPKFMNRYYLIKDVYESFLENLNPQFLKENDPFWDPQEPQSIGQGFFSMLPLAYLMKNQANIPLVGKTGQIGSVFVEIGCYEETTQDFREDWNFLKNPREIIGQKQVFLARFSKLNFLQEGIDLDDLVLSFDWVGQENEVIQPINKQQVQEIFFTRLFEFDCISQPILNAFFSRKICVQILSFLPKIQILKEIQECFEKEHIDLDESFFEDEFLKLMGQRQSVDLSQSSQKIQIHNDKRQTVKLTIEQKKLFEKYKRTQVNYKKRKDSCSIF